jgi:DNA-binding PadR family transcriptional regulator
MHHQTQHHAHGRSHHDHGKRFAREEGNAGRKEGDREGRHGGRGRHGGGPGHDPARALRRFFAHGDLRLVILSLIAEKPRHGYEIIKEIEERVAGAYSPSPGVIYPTLTLLEELGYVSVTLGEGGRRAHAITDAGRSFLAANGPAVEALFARMAEASQTRGGEAAPEIRSAMENLQRALRMRLSRGPLDRDQVTAITTVLDAAAISIEQR